MKSTVVLAALASAIVAAPAYAQMNSDKTTQAPRSTTTPPAVASPSDIDKTTSAPVAGKNSFTEGQAMTRLQDNGYTDVTGLMKDDQSVWHAKAMKAGKAVNVTLDYQGNITMKAPPEVKSPAAMNTAPDSASKRIATNPPLVPSTTEMNKSNVAPMTGTSTMGTSTAGTKLMGKHITESQAMKHLQDQGYSDITKLMMDQQSLWHASAMKAGKPVEVALDSQGNATSH